MASTSTKPDHEAVMPLGDHLEELRTRLVHALLGLIPIFAISLIFGQRLLAFLLEPLKTSMRAAGHSGSPLATEPLEVFGTYIKVSVIAAIVVGSPWVLYQAWKFVAPGLYAREKRYVYFLLPLSSALTSTGLIFLYRIVMPLLLAFFLDFGAGIGLEPSKKVNSPTAPALPVLPVLDGDPADPATGAVWINAATNEQRVCIKREAGQPPTIMSMPLQKPAGVRQEFRVGAYISLLLSLSLAFAVSFQTPVVVLLLGWAGMIDLAWVARFRRHALFACAVIAAMLTPGDVASMLLLWVPLYALYELGGLLLRFFPAERVSRGLSGKEPDAEAD